MLQQYFNWRTLLAFIAIGIVTGTIFYSNYLAGKIAKEERQKVEEWVEASNSILSSGNTDTRLAFKIIQDNDDVPIILTNQKDSIVEWKNLDTAKLSSDPTYLYRKLNEFKSENDPIKWYDPGDSTRFNNYYFGHTSLLNQVRYYPIVQLIIVALFIVITLLALQSRNRSTQNQLWAGMAKETAHQLGTPVSSLQGWVEMLRETKNDEKIVAEMEKDINRLKLVSDRFGKIGSTPQLTPTNLARQVENMMDYMKRRAADKVKFELNKNGADDLQVSLSPQLFDWVIENLLKNALDSMEGSGQIKVELFNEAAQAIIEVTDTGKGIPRSNWNSIFNPGFTTKKRGWGLGLSLSKRIIEQYHKGQLFVKNSEAGKGTTFKIVLNK